MTTDFILRIFIAAMLGGIIGLEREFRAKDAGFRTHFLVGLGAALFMIMLLRYITGLIIQRYLIITK